MPNICKFYSNGHCLNGSRCRFQHIDPSYSREGYNESEFRGFPQINVYSYRRSPPPIKDDGFILFLEDLRSSAGNFLNNKYKYPFSTLVIQNVHFDDLLDFSPEEYKYFEHVIDSNKNSPAQPFVKRQYYEFLETYYSVVKDKMKDYNQLADTGLIKRLKYQYDNRKNHNQPHDFTLFKKFMEKINQIFAPLQQFPPTNINQNFVNPPKSLTQNPPASPIAFNFKTALKNSMPAQTPQHLQQPSGYAYQSTENLSNTCMTEAISSYACGSTNFYSPLESVTAKDKEAFLMDHFNMNEIPTLPPPRQYCF